MPASTGSKELPVAPAVVAVAAAAAPSLLAYNLSPSPTFLNQALALALWAAFVLACAARAVHVRLADTALLTGALALVAGGVLISWARHLPSSLALSALGLLAAAAVLAVAGAAARRDASRAKAAFVAFACAWVVAGVLNTTVGMVQVFAPDLADGQWIASTNLPGRAVGNLRQPNHLSSLLLWAVIAAVALAELGALSRRLVAALIAIFLFGVVLTASRTGVVSVILLAVWGALDRRLAPRMRLVLLAAPVLYALAWFGMAQWAAMSQRTFGGAVRMAEDVAAGADVTSARLAIWSHTLALVRESPWLGVGFGEFNYAWTLTSFPDRPKAFFDHTHNLPLHLAVELGLPLAAAVMALLLLALWRAARAAWSLSAEGARGVSAEGACDVKDEGARGVNDEGACGARAGVLMVLMIGLHSLLEYPLWYAYFLLPIAWAWGYAAGRPSPTPSPTQAAASPSPARPSLPLAAAAGAVVLGAALSIADYTRVVAIFSASEGDAPLAQRIEAGRRSVFFAHHADYAAVTSGVPMRDAAASFADTTHYLLDSRLMIAWAEWLDQQGHADLARHLAASLREFRSDDAAEFFAECPGRTAPPAGSVPATAPFQCQRPARTPNWREYLSVRARR
ncbi:MAG: O-antigen ligase C-terminal domain-containing protein [Rubrivivax sp.]|nr:O-antigen ligase C-terminal domain-containing protein [Rubrivivax sp.]